MVWVGRDWSLDAVPAINYLSALYNVSTCLIIVLLQNGQFSALDTRSVDKALNEGDVSS